jgi:hypothetical protein
LALAALVVVAAGALAFLVQSNRRVVHAFNQGPIQGGGATGTRIIADELGQAVTFGGIVLENSSSSPAVLEEIRVVPPLDDGIKILAIEVAGRERRYGMVGADQGFPPPDLAPHLRPYRGAVIPPLRTPAGEEGVEIVFGFRIDRAGSYGFREVHIDYRVGKKRHTVQLEDGFLACAPQSAFPDGCGDDEFFESQD